MSGIRNKMPLQGKVRGNTLGQVQARVEQEARTNLGGCVSIAYGTPCRDGAEVTVAYVAVESHVLEDFGAGFHKCVKCGENGTPTRPLSSRLAYLVQGLS